MIGKKIAGLTVAALLVAALSIPPAEAGLGGCLVGCRPQAAQTTPVVVKGASVHPLLSAARWVLPTDLYAALQGYVRGGASASAKTEGLGGCYSGICLCGLGGCKQ